MPDMIRRVHVGKHEIPWYGNLLATVLLLGMAGAAGAEIIDAVLATVDNEVILRSDIMREIGPYLGNLRLTARNEDEFNQSAEAQVRAALDQAVENKILLREALRAGLEVTDEQVEERIEEIRKRYPSNEEFHKVLEEAGETMSDFRTHVRKQILAIAMGMRKRRAFEEEALVSEGAVAQYYQDHKQECARPERVRLRRIFLSANQDPGNRAQGRARLAGLREELEAGADFAALAKAYSEGPEAENGGVVGWAARGDLVEELETAAFALAEDEISDIVETEFGFHVLKAEQKEEAGVPSLEELRTEIEPELRRQYADERYATWMGELRKRSRVRIFL